jgi:hypothetical protein
MYVCAFFRHYSIFSRTHKCPGPYPWGYPYPRLGITAVDDPCDQWCKNPCGTNF